MMSRLTGENKKGYSILLKLLPFANLILKICNKMSKTSIAWIFKLGQVTEEDK